MHAKCIRENTKSFVLDAEAVAVDRTTGKLMPFQELSKRKRKDVKVEDIQVRVCLFAFDLLYLNGEVRPVIVPYSQSSAFSVLASFAQAISGTACSVAGTFPEGAL